MPSTGATSANGSDDSIDCRYTGLLWTLAPGVVPPRRSATATTRCDGTNTSWPMVFLLPVPPSPMVNQLSSSDTSARGTMKNAGRGVALSLGGGIMPPRKSHCM
jgi:hypothetical protein